MRSATIVLAAALLAAGCASTDVPQYSTRVEESAPGTLVVHVASNEGMSRDELHLALLREASRAAIDRGAIYLRVNEIDDQAAVEVEERVSSSPNPPSTGQDPTTESSQVSFGRRRNGSIRITTSREPLPGDNAFDASALLSRVNSGSLPELKF